MKNLKYIEEYNWEVVHNEVPLSSCFVAPQAFFRFTGPLKL